MTNHTTESSENTTASHSERITELEAALAEAIKRKDEVYLLTYKLIKENELLTAQNAEAQIRIRKLEDPEGRDNGRLSWLSKIVLLLRM